MKQEPTEVPHKRHGRNPRPSGRGGRQRLRTVDEAEQLRAENDRLRRELERVTAGRDHAVDLHDAASRELRELRRGLARIAGERNDARAERDRYRQLVGELQAALVHVADRLHEIERYARRQADAEPASAPGSPRRAQELPAWVYQLVAGLARYAAEHPPLYARYAGRSDREHAECPCSLLDLVPREVREAALRHADVPSTPAASDGQDDTSESAQEALQRAPRTTVEYSADGHCWRCWDCGWVSVGYADRRAAAHGAELHECPTEDGADG